MSGTSNLHNYQIIIDRLFQYLVCHHLSPPSPLLLWTSIILKLPTLILQGWILRGCAKAPFPGPSTASSTTFTSLPLSFCQFLQGCLVFDWWKSCKNIIFFSVSHSLNVMDFIRYAPLWFSAPHGYHRLTLISLVRYRLFFPDIELLFNPTNIISHQAWMIEHLLQIWNFQDIHMVFFLFMYMSGSIPSSLRRNPIGVLFFKPKVSATLDTWKKISAIIKLGGQNEQLRYESSTLILCKELSSTIFALWVCQASVTPVQISTFCNI